MGREENVLIFQDTERLSKTNGKLNADLKTSASGQKLILETDALEKPNLNIYDEPAKVIVSKKRTFEAAKAYRDNKVAVHNFASASNPGGGVVRGSTAQEECLCRCSYLYFCLNSPDMWDGFYTPHKQARNPLHNDDIIYTPEVTVFKSDTNNPALLPENEWAAVYRKLDIFKCMHIFFNHIFCSICNDICFIHKSSTSKCSKYYCIVSFRNGNIQYAS